MSVNKRTVQKYMDAFARSDHAEILSCLTDDVEWKMPGAFHLTGENAFDKGHPPPAAPPVPGERLPWYHGGMGFPSRTISTRFQACPS